jgi:hypothetical protein
MNLPLTPATSDEATMSYDELARRLKNARANMVKKINASPPMYLWFYPDTLQQAVVKDRGKPFSDGAIAKILARLGIPPSDFGD